MESVDLMEILFSLRRRWTFIMAVCILTTLLAGIYSFIIATPIYESTVSLYVYKNTTNTDSLTYNDMLLNNQLAKDYKELISSKSVLNDVINNLELTDMGYNQLKNSVEANLKQDTRLLLISVRNENAQQATSIANEVAEVFSVKVKEIMKIDNVTIIDRAEDAKFPVSPNKKVNIALGVIIGLVIGVGISLALDFFDNKVRYPEDLKKRYEYPIIGAIPLIGNDEDEKNFAMEGNKYILDETSKIFEPYRATRTNVMFASVDNPYKTILITSSVPGEGKTSCSANLATAFARAGQKTIIVDVDLRKPRVHKAFKLNTVKGLTSVLAADIEIERVIKSNVIDNLDVLPAGIRPPNPAELLGSKAMANLLEKLRENYDIVILDSPPVGVFTDAATIAGKVDGAIYVVSSGVAGYTELNRGIESLKNVGANLIGFVMTRVDTDAKGREYYNYKYSYYYGDSKGN